MQPEIQPPIGFLTPTIADLSPETRIRVSAIGTENCSRADTNVTRSMHPGWSIGSTTGASGLAGFLSVDPLAGDPAAPQSWNRYTYVLNDPLVRTDPDGRDTYDVIEGAANGWSSSNLFDLNRVDPRNSDYATGQTIGDGIAVISGTYETLSGIAGTAGSGLVTVFSGGTSSPVTVPAAGVAVVETLHGLTTTAVAAVNLARDIAHGSQKSGTEPTLPDKTIASGNGVKVEHNYRSGDHPPAHAHVTGGGPETRIGPNGKPLKGNPELTSAQRTVVEQNKAVIRRAINKIGRWLAFNE